MKIPLLSALDGLIGATNFNIWDKFQKVFSKRRKYSLLDKGNFSHLKHFLLPPFLVILVDYNVLVEEGGFCSFENQVGTLEHFLLFLIDS